MDIGIIVGIFIIIGCVALFYLYGHVQYNHGKQDGRVMAYVQGQIYGAQSVINLFEQLQLINLDEVEAAIKSGKYDHIGEVGKIRKLYFPDDINNKSETIN